MTDERKDILKIYEDYFKEDLKAIDDELETSKKYSKIIDAEIDKLSAPGLPTKGSQHYLIEHITNAVQLQTQREGLRKDKVNIKKIIMDYTNKQIDKSAGSTNEESLTEVINKLLAQDKAKEEEVSVVVADDNSDDEIDKILDETEESK